MPEALEACHELSSYKGQPIARVSRRVKDDARRGVRESWISVARSKILMQLGEVGLRCLNLKIRKSKMRR